MKNLKRVLIFSLVSAMIALTLAGCAGKGEDTLKEATIQSFTTNGESFKVGILSDTQLPPTEKKLEENDKFLQNLKKSLTVLKNNEVDMILFAGDIGDLGTRFAFQTHIDTFREVFGDDMPIVQHIMGNHDYWNKNAFTAINHRKAFTEIIGQSPWTHYVVNGFHFIGASPNVGSMDAGYRMTAKWLDNEIQRAAADSEGKPIFVMTHNQPVDTSYGSEDWGDTTLDAVLSKYPNVINISGHVHYSMLDERSVWQDKYTVIQTQSVSYTEMEGGKDNGTIPPNADATPMGYIMDITPENITVHRINFANGEMGTEEKADVPWTFPLPFENDGRYGFEKRKLENAAPVVTETSGKAEISGDTVKLIFPAASDDDFVHSYKVVIDGKEERLFFSDFYNGLDSMAKEVTLEIKELKNPAEKHSFEVFAIDSWDAVSEQSVKIEM